MMNNTERMNQWRLYMLKRAKNEKEIPESECSMRSIGEILDAISHFRRIR